LWTILGELCSIGHVDHESPVIRASGISVTVLDWNAVEEEFALPDRIEICRFSHNRYRQM